MGYNGNGVYIPNNNYPIGNQFMPSYSQSNYQQFQNQNINQNMNMMQNNQPQQAFNNPYDYPLIGVRFVNESEANAFTIPPNSRIFLMDRDNQVFWMKWADSMGQSAMEKYKFFRFDENIQAQQQTQSPQIDTNQFIKKEDLSNFICKEDLKGFVKVEELPKTIGRDEFNSLMEKVEILEKRIKINEITKGDIVK